MKESPYDAMGAGHSSTSISAAQGYSIAKVRNFLTNCSVQLLLCHGILFLHVLLCSSPRC